MSKRSKTKMCINCKVKPIAGGAGQTSEYARRKHLCGRCYTTRKAQEREANMLYDVVDAFTAKELRNAVNDMMKKGWEPLGSPAVVETSFEGEMYFVQAMTRLKENNNATGKVHGLRPMGQQVG